MNWNIYQQFLRLPYLIRLLLVVAFILFLFGTSIHFVEPEQFPTVFDGIWWAIITTSTIGYGDFVPITIPGRIIGILLVLFGAGFVATFFVSLATSAVQKQNAIMKGTLELKITNHFIVIGWNERSKEIVQDFVKVNRDRQIVLIDSTLDNSPFINKNNLFFVKGAPSLDATLEKANVRDAELVIITADPRKNELEADMNTILNIVAVKGLAPSIYCIAEILTKEQIINAKRAGADEIIQTNTLSSFVMLHTMLSHGISDSLLDIFNILKGVKVQLLTDNEFVGESFQQVSTNLLKKHIILIGVKQDENNTLINPNGEYIIQHKDRLLVIGEDLRN
ncbi:potassium channel family protein [Bacillus kwashiorkori]|uniref:potassium channel family protein n=1 Tax=Bacillus kwashiorkori TaxID=1522318 RepID=UPI0007840856|nr:potassium channel protein [Bacillus kwashiorkori]